MSFNIILIDILVTECNSNLINSELNQLSVYEERGEIRNKGSI